MGQAKGKQPKNNSRPRKRAKALTAEERLRLTRRRLVGTGLCLLIFFSIAGYKAFRLQVFEQDQLLREAERNYLREMVVEFRRGDIVDRNGEPLATSIRVDTIVANPRQVQNPEHTARTLANILSGVDEAALIRKLASNSWWEYVKRRVSGEESERVSALNLPGIQITEEWKRFYPKRELAGQVLGRTGLDAEGLEGLERAFDHLLVSRQRASADGTALLEVVKVSYIKDIEGRAAYVEGLPGELAPEGYTLQLTIDEKIQDVVEGSLARAVEKHQARSAMAVVMDVPTGEVLALANYPLFNPNQAGSYDMYLWKNRAVKEQFEPGSTLKIFSLAAVFDQDAATLDEKIDTGNGRLRVGRHWIHDTHQIEGLTVRGVIGFSSNIGIVKLTQRIGKKALDESLRGFGFGKSTNFDMDSEAAGFIQALENWADITFANISFGQGIAVTAIQLASALAALGNEGALLRPRLVRRVVTHDGRVIKTFGVEKVRQAVKPSSARKVIDAMKACVEPGGTGVAAAIPGFTVAGKTGTAQKPETAYSNGRRIKNLKTEGGYKENAWIASFVGLVPAEKPRLAIVVLVDEPQGDAYGGLVAAPVFREIGQWALAYLGVSPSTTRPIKVSSVRKADVVPAFAAGKGIGKKVGFPVVMTSEPEVSPGIPVVPNLLGKSMGEVVKDVRPLGVVLELAGTGTAIYQSISPGSAVMAGQGLLVRFESAVDRRPSELADLEEAP